MNRIQSIAITTVACSVSAAAAVAAGPLAPVDTEQRAAAASITVVEESSRAQGIIAVISGYSTPYAQVVFNSLNAAAITAPALRNMPDGATRPCLNGGSFNVRMARSFPRVLQIEWTNCQIARWDPGATTGPGQITLFSDNFRPEQVAGIRLGNATRDFVSTIDYSSSGGELSVRTRNVRMTGWIPMFGPDYDVDSYTRYAYDISGFVRDVSDTYDVLNSAENAATIGVIANLQQGYYYDEEQRLLWGKLTTTQIDPNWGTLTYRFGVENLAVRRVIDYNAMTSGFSVDGTLDVQFPTGGRAGELYRCRDGRFSVRTVTPLFNADANSSVRDSGELRINGVATARYFSAATVPPNLPPPTNGTLINMDVRGVGTFNYDGFAALYAKAACP